MKCAVCGEVVKQKQPLHLHQGDDHIQVCSYECLIAYSVERIRLRIAYHNRRMRVVARHHPQCTSLRAGASVKHRS